MDPAMISAIEIHLGGFTLEIQQSILVWLILCVLFAFFFWFAGRKIEQADPSRAPKGLVYVCEEIYNLILYVVQGNLKETTARYIPFFGTLIIMMLVSNLTGLVGLQNPTSNVSFNATLALTLWVMIQGSAIRKAGLKARMKELTEPMWLLTPLNIIGELALPISLTMRLFGNILAGSIITMLVYTLIKNIAPWGYLGLTLTPFLHMYFDIFSGVIQTYIFFTLGSYFLGQQVSKEAD
ncbi:F0F1 ATP synthase subunit A [Faecalibaculum rodentium]|uniref:F0F1 ATP synthase subunit A n=2 Tax=Faecalibaculum rodentium TaxID=1702221 RepID=UPI0023F486E7|nr:F0F1 ATP synthase subunit A [Faecalibaculum rodentium]